jgi:hypothetical protein
MYLSTSVFLFRLESYVIFIPSIYGLFNDVSWSDYVESNGGMISE